MSECLCVCECRNTHNSAHTQTECSTAFERESNKLFVKMTKTPFGKSGKRTTHSDKVEEGGEVEVEV